MKKFTKKELREELKTIINTVDFDLNITNETIIDNYVYEDYSDYKVDLDKSARIVLMRAKQDQEHTLRRLIELLNGV